MLHLTPQWNACPWNEVVVLVLKNFRHIKSTGNFKTYQRVYWFNTGTIHSELKMIKYWYFDKHVSLKKLTPDFDFQRTHQGAHPTSYQRSASPEENYSSHNRSRSSRSSWLSRSSWSFRSPRLWGLWGRWLRRIRSPWISVNHP